MDLITAMIAGRVIWGCARYICAGLGAGDFGLAAFWAGAVTNAIPGIIIQIVLVPAVVAVYAKLRKKSAK